MKRLKKLFSLVLGVCTLFTSIPNVCAGGDDKVDSRVSSVINVAVVGDDDVGKLNLINYYTTEQNGSYKGIKSFTKVHGSNRINFFDIPSDLGSENKDQKAWINNFLQSSRKNIFTPYCSFVIICLNVQNNSEEELVRRTDYWLRDIKSRNKDHQMEVVLYHLPREKDVSDHIDEVNAVIEKVGDFEDEFMSQNKGIYQFRRSTTFPFGDENVVEHILEGSHLYLKKNSFLADPSFTNIGLILGGVGLGLLAISGIVLGITYFMSK